MLTIGTSKPRTRIPSAPASAPNPPLRYWQPRHTRRQNTVLGRAIIRWFCRYSSGCAESESAGNWKKGGRGYGWRSGEGFTFVEGAAGLRNWLMGIKGGINRCDFIDIGIYGVWVGSEVSWLWFFVIFVLLADRSWFPHQSKRFLCFGVFRWGTTLIRENNPEATD